jgi:hypothetical protein
MLPLLPDDLMQSATHHTLAIGFTRTAIYLPVHLVAAPRQVLNIPMALCQTEEVFTMDMKACG